MLNKRAALVARPAFSFFDMKTFKNRLLVLSAVFCALAFLLPNHYPPWRSFYLEFSAFVALWLLLAYLSLSHQKYLQAPRWTIAVSATALVPLIQVWADLVHFSGDGSMAALYLAAFAVVYATGYTLAESAPERFAQGIAWAFLCASLISALLVLCQWARTENLGIWLVEIAFGDRKGANLAQPNHLATLLSLGIASTIYLYERQKLGAFLSWLFVVMLILGIITSESRTPILGAAFLLIWWAAKRTRMTRIPASAIVLSLGFYIGLILLWPWFQNIWFSGVLTHGIAQIGIRSIIVPQLIDAALRAPWYGYGWGQVSAAQLAVVTDYPQTVWVEHSHNLILDLLIWNGIPLGLLITSGISYWLWTRARRCQTAESWFCLLAIGLMMIHGMTEFPLEYAYFLLPLGFLAGITEADQKQAATFTVPRGLVWSALLICTLFMGVIWHEYQLIEADYRIMRFETSRIGTLKANQPAPDVILLTQLREDLRYARTEAHANMTQLELEWMKQVTFRYPYFASLFRYSLALALNNQGVEATLQIQRIHKLYGDKPYAFTVSGLKELSQSRYPQLQSWTASLPLLPN